MLQSLTDLVQFIGKQLCVLTFFIVCISMCVTIDSSTVIEKKCFPLIFHEDPMVLSAVR